jgi:hypothetical protein
VIIQVHPRVLGDPRWHPLLDVVVSILEQPYSRHSFDVTQYKNLEKSAWLSGATGIRSSLAASIKSSAKAVSRDGASNAITILIDDLAPASGRTEDQQREIHIHPLGALTILMQPLHLIVEDENSDGAFILWMARLLGRDTIGRCYRQGRLLFRHAGGKGQMLKSAKALTFGVWPRDNQPILSLQLRAVGLLDSDSRFVGDQGNLEIFRALIPHVAFVKMLKGRSIENYVPSPYLRRWLQQDRPSAGADAYSRMTEEQRNHFPLKKGFRNSAPPSAPQSQAAFLADNRYSQGEHDLYRTISQQDWVQLAAGFGDKISEIFRMPEFRSQPKDAGLLTRDQRNELNEFFSQVIRYL